MICHCMPGVISPVFVLGNLYILEKCSFQLSSVIIHPGRMKLSPYPEATNALYFFGPQRGTQKSPFRTFPSLKSTKSVSVVASVAARDSKQETSPIWGATF